MLLSDKIDIPSGYLWFIIRGFQTCPCVRVDTTAVIRSRR